MVRNNFSKLLDKLQQESWQLELLISGLAIFGLVQASQALGIIKVTGLANSENIVLKSFLAIIITSVRIFTINLIVHVIFRGLWIAAIGLRSVSGKINYDAFKYNDRFKYYLKSKMGTFDDYIERLEKYSSIIFAYTFLLVFVTISFFIFFILFLAPIVYLSERKGGVTINEDWLSVLFILYLLGGLIVAFDFITQGLLKRVKQKHFAWTYHKIYVFYSTITLSFLWRPLYYNFLDHKFSRRLLFLIIPYFVLIGFIYNFSTDDYNYFPDNNAGHVISEYRYDDLREKNKIENKDYYAIEAISIPSYKISDQYLEVFIKYTKDQELSMEEDDKSFQETTPQKWYERLTGSATTPIDSRNKALSQIDSIYEAQRDSIRYDYGIEYSDRTEQYSEYDAIMDSLLTEVQIRKNTVRKKLTAKTLKAYKGTFDLYIDEQRVVKEDLICNYYTHPNAGEKGLLCFIDTDSLTKGIHELKYSFDKAISRTKWREEVSVPFLFVPPK